MRQFIFSNMLLFIFAFIIFVGCTPQTIHRKNIICLIDYSGSIKQKTLENYAYTIVNDVFMNMSQFDKMVLIPIDEGSKQKSVQLLHFDLAEYKFSKPGDGLTYKQDSIEKRLKEFKIQCFDSIYHQVFLQKDVRKDYVKLTDILAALEQVSSLKETNDTASTVEHFWRGLLGESEVSIENVVIIFSDMIHESEELNFNHVNFTQESINALLSKITNKYKQFNLLGCKIFVSGRTGNSNEMIEGIENFWTAYFKEFKAELKAYDYDCKSIGPYLQKKIN